jgi:ComF family protein
MMFVNIQKIINFIYPPKCILCDKHLAYFGLCSGCYIKLDVSYNYCKKCGFILKNDYKLDENSNCLGCNNKKLYFDSLTYRHIYNDSIYRIIYKFKEKDETYLAKFLANIFCNTIDVNKHKYDVIIPVPIHYFKLLKRKYSHMVILAKFLSKITGIDHNFMALKKVKNTKEQKLLSGKDRRVNLSSAFAISDKYAKLIKDKVILLIDDVVTTGITIQECAKTLKKAGAKEVHVIAIARVDGILKI